jgi:succinate dehydrogenase/fumarate reductase flavoprotein subunit
MAWHGWLDAHYEAHQGRAPLFPIRNGEASNNSVLGPGAYGAMHGHAVGGIRPVDTTCASNIPGLYAAGDNISTNFLGAIYSGFGFTTTHASVTGARAGVNAAEYVKNAKDISLSKNRISKVKQIVFDPIERKGGFTPKWTTHVLQSYLMPYYVMYIKHKDRLETALKQIEYLRDHIAPKLIAKDSHELRLASETKNMIMNAEMKLRSSIFREESRGNHYREDFPQRDDSNWLAWVVLKDKNGKMETSKDPIPKEWWPDQSMPYNKRYPLEFPKA